MKTARWTWGLTGTAVMSLALGCENANPPTAPALGKALAARDVVASGPTGAPDLSLTTIDAPGATFTEAIDIGPTGDVVGRYITSDGKSHGYLLHEGVFTPIDLSSTLTGAQGINSREDIVGYFQGTDRAHGFLLHDGTSTTIDVPGAVATRAMGINDRSDIVGTYCEPACPSTANRADLGNHGFLLRQGSVATIDFPDAVVTQPFKINSAGDIVGRYQKADGTWHAFLLRGGSFSSVDVPGAVETASFPPPVGINKADNIVGSYCAVAPCPARVTDNLATLAHVHGFMLRREDRDDGAQFTTIDVPGASGTAPYSINAHSDVVGAYVDANHKVHGFLRSKADAAVPVAGTFKLTFEPVTTRQVDGNTVSDFTFQEQVDGSIAGTRIGTGTLVVHPDGSLNVKDAGVFSGTVAGVPGSVIAEVEAAGTFASFTAIARFAGNTGTGGLKGLRGTLAVTGGATGPGTLTGSYEGQVSLKRRCLADQNVNSTPTRACVGG